MAGIRTDAEPSDADPDPAFRHRPHQQPPERDEGDGAVAAASGEPDALYDEWDYRRGAGGGGGGPPDATPLAPRAPAGGGGWAAPTTRGIQAEWRMNGTVTPGLARTASGPRSTAAASKTSTRNPASFMIGTTPSTFIGRSVLGMAIAATAVVLIPGAASANDADVRVSGKCSGNSVWKLKAKPEDGGRNGTGTLNIQSAMGAIMSVGVAVANAILLVTFAERSRIQSKDALMAAVEGGRSPRRPILMTSF